MYCRSLITLTSIDIFLWFTGQMKTNQWKWEINGNGNKCNLWKGKQSKKWNWDIKSLKSQVMRKSKYDTVTSLVPTQKVGLYQEIYVKIMPHSFLLICVIQFWLFGISWVNYFFIWIYFVWFFFFYIKSLKPCIVLLGIWRIRLTTIIIINIIEHLV